ncbi:MAG: hypothetical protein QOD99_2118, partial [Chthoniobacter sp.]|nr:hypothetical protein [Chthoniobacter sp.]
GNTLNNGDSFAFGANRFQIRYDGDGTTGNEVLLIVAPVPEPSVTVCALSGAGLFGFLARRRRRSGKDAAEAFALKAGQ